MGYYMLEEDGRTPRAVPDQSVLQWARWMENSPARQVAYDQIGPYHVSTIFLGLDHNYARMFGREAAGDPILWETMAFGPDQDVIRASLLQCRYSSREAAEAGHAEALKRIRAHAYG